MNRHKRTILRAVLLCAAAASLMLIGLRLTDSWQAAQYREQREEGTKALMTSDLVEWEGAGYKKTPGVTTLLVVGIDQETDRQQGVGTSRYRNGGQADFILLLAIDHTNRMIHRLQLDRDLMTAVTVLSVYGQETGERTMQICLSHSYGANREENARYTLRAVRKALDGLEIDGYYMVGYQAVAAFNDTLGGVTVTVPDDMTALDPRWSAGSVVTLNGREAEKFVRARKTAGSGTNVERMARQIIYMNQAILQWRKCMSQDASFGVQLLSSLKTAAVTNMSDQQLMLEIKDSNAYEIMPVEYLGGEYVTGKSGYTEFHMADGSAKSWIMRHLYTRQ